MCVQFVYLRVIVLTCVLGIFTLITMYLCILAQIVLYAWCADAAAGVPKGFALAAAVFATLPLVALVPKNLFHNPAHVANVVENRRLSPIVEETRTQVLSPSPTVTSLPTTTLS